MISHGDISKYHHLMRLKYVIFITSCYEQCYGGDFGIFKLTMQYNSLIFNNLCLFVFPIYLW